MNQDVFPKVQEALQESLGIPREKITLKARIIDDLGSDSLDLLDILFALEEKFGVKIKRGQLEAQARQGISEEEFQQDGCLSEIGAQRLRSVMPEVDPGEVKAGMPLVRIPHLFTVETFCRLVEQSLENKN
jgi:acyl carrier protein